MKVEELFAHPTLLSTIIGRSSVDNSIDDGFLANARKANPQAGHHNNTQQGINNLIGGDDDKVLVGHGNLALIVTGSGQNSSDPQKCISIWNEGNWRPILSKLRGQCRTLSLCACHTGTAAEGAKFLHRLAQILNCRVLGPTGYVYCNWNGIFIFEPRSTWQEATPTRLPSPIRAPTPFFREVVDTFVLAQENIMIDFKLSDVTRLSFIPLLRDTLNAIPLLTLTGSGTQNMLHRLALSAPFTLPGVPGALATGRLVVEFEKNNHRKSFLVLNDRMLQDEDQPEMYRYWSDDAPRIILNNL